jgi:hypothetical protein
MSGWGGPHTDERVIAVGPRSLRRLDIRDGTLDNYLVQDADTGEYASYHRREKRIYVADLRPLLPTYALVVAHNAKTMWKSESFEEGLALLQQHLKGKAVRKSVTDGVYRVVQPMQVATGGGKPTTQDYEIHRACQVVTISWTVAKTPKPITSRVEFYLDSDTKRPFAERQYLNTEGQPERVIGHIVNIEYDVPFPARDAIEFPPGTKEVHCTARPLDIRNQYGHAVGFELLADGRQVVKGTVHVPD